MRWGSRGKREIRRLSVLSVGKLDIELENVRRWNVTAVVRKEILRDSAMQRKEVSGGREKKQVKRGKNGSRTESRGMK